MSSFSLTTSNAFHDPGIRETMQLPYMFRLNIKYLRWPYRAYIKTAKNGDFCEELLSENNFEAVLATFCYDQGAKVLRQLRR